MFPLEVKSGIVARAPIVTPEDTALFASEEGLQDIVLEMLDIMLYFYGLKRGKKAIKVKNERLLRYQLRPYNHNLLRISRILRSLRLLGRGKESIALFEVLEDSLGEVQGLKRTFSFWHKAVYGPFEFPGTADGPPGASSQQSAGAAGRVSSTAANSSSSSSKIGTSSWSMKPLFTSKRKAQPEHLQVIRSSIFSSSENPEGLDAATSVQLPGSTDSATTSDINVDASRKDDACNGQTSDSGALPRPVASPSSNHQDIPNGSSCANGSEQLELPQHGRDGAHASAHRSDSSACAMPSTVMEQGQHDASGHASAVLDSKHESHSGLQVYSQPNDPQKTADLSALLLASSTPAADLKVDGTAASHVGPGNQRISSEMPSTYDMTPVGDVQQASADTIGSEPSPLRDLQVTRRTGNDHL